LKKKTVTVNDKMQRGYRYVLTRPIGRNFDPDFRPELTPAEMLQLGVFGGKYMTDCTKEFPKSWFVRAKLAKKHRDRLLNYFGVEASQPLSVWRNKGWIFRDDPRGWFQWYCRYYMAAAFSTRTRGRSSAGKRSAATCGKSSAIASRATSPAGRGNARRCCIGPMTAGKSRPAPNPWP
jgi:hypothetical protein